MSKKTITNTSDEQREANSKSESANHLTDERNARFEAVIECFPTGLLGIDGQGKIQLVNEELEKMFGYRREEMVGQPVEILIPHAVRERHVEDVRVYLKQPRAKILGEGRDLEGCRKDGGVFPVEVGLRPIRGGGTLAALAAVTDITARKKIEEDLRRSNEELEHFAYVASHDLQEPIRMIGSFAELLQRDYSASLDERGHRWMNHLVDGAGRMRALIQGLLSYSRVGTQELRRDVVDTKEVIDQVLADLALAIQESGAKIIVGDMSKVVGDQNLIRLVFQNLIANAIKFQPEGAKPEVRVECSGGRALSTFCVRDNGIGIEAQYFERIFMIFQRLHGKSRYPGTGLGLAICEKVVQRHGGKIWVESKPGEGSAFYFTVINKMQNDPTEHE